jgi:cytochrome bd-type quinol oxidase subunit 1
VTEPKSKVEYLARSLHRLAILLLGAFVIAGIAALLWVDDEFHGEAPLWRDVIGIASASGFLIAAVIAQVGSALVETLGRVRASLLDAILEERQQTDGLVPYWPERGSRS